MRYKASIDKVDGSPSILVFENENTDGRWFASFADAETRDAVLAMLIERDEVK